MSSSPPARQDERGREGLTTHQYPIGGVNRYEEQQPCECGCEMEHDTAASVAYSVSKRVGAITTLPG